MHTCKVRKHANVFIWISLAFRFYIKCSTIWKWKLKIEKRRKKRRRNGSKTHNENEFKSLRLLPYKCEWCSLVLYLAEEEEDLEGAVLSGLSILGFESVGDAVTPSSELLLLADPSLLAVVAGIELHTESSERERPMKRDTLPVPWRTASLNVPSMVLLMFRMRFFVLFCFYEFWKCE